METEPIGCTQCGATMDGSYDNIGRIDIERERDHRTGDYDGTRQQTEERLAEGGDTNSKAKNGMEEIDASAVRRRAPTPGTIARVARGGELRRVGLGEQQGRKHSIPKDWKDTLGKGVSDERDA